LALDYLSIAMSEIGNISERRTFQLMSGLRELPAFLVRNAGLNSGMMILQYTAASIVSKNKLLANPCSTDSIVSSNGQEDHVSMGANSAVKNHELLHNVERVLAIELIAATEAVEIRGGATSDLLQGMMRSFRESVHPLEKDRVMYTDIANAVDYIQQTQLELSEMM
jgi:histidine ammonia-lyase (EC 4.3.1.3)